MWEKMIDDVQIENEKLFLPFINFTDAFLFSLE